MAALLSYFLVVAAGPDRARLVTANLHCLSSPIPLHP